MSRVTPEEVRHVAQLARIALTEAEVGQFQQQLERILEHVTQLQRLNTDQVEPTSHVLPLTNVMREDAPQPCLPSEIVAKLAPARQGPFIKVPRIIE